MAGLLDNKTRILDTIVTQLGRTQLVEGGIDISYVTFTDGDTFYDADAVSGSADATNRIYFEASSLPQDLITFKADAAGKIVADDINTNDFFVKSGQLISYQIVENPELVTGSNQRAVQLTGAELLSAANTLLAATPDNFQKLRAISTKDAIFNDGFAVAPASLNFVINEKPLNHEKRSVNINDYPNMFHDTRFSKLLNFRYLPPIVKTNDKLIDKKDPEKLKGFALGNYIPASVEKSITADVIETELLQFEKQGFAITTTIEPGTRRNNIIGQFFEISQNDVSKLDVFDFGKIIHENVSKHVFFVGKVLLDDFGIQKFIHLFTLVFE